MPSPASPTSFLPLTPVAFEILLALAGDELHGYAILQEIERRSEGRLAPHAGTLYRALARLVDDRLLEELDERPDPASDDERRRYYRLTALGREVGAAEALRLESQVQSARASKLLRPRRA